MQSYRPKNIKEHNQKFITKVLRESDVPLTKSQIARQTDLSVVTINKILPEMIALNKINELASPVHTGGRKALVYKLNELFEVILIIQFIELDSQINALFVVTDLLGNIISDNDLIVTEISQDKISQSVQKFKANFPNLNTAVVGIPGVNIKGTLRIMDYDPLLNFNLKQLITAENIATVLIENDVNAASLGFTCNNNVILAGLYFPKSFPPGSALIINGQIFHGKNNLSGEIKHLPSYQHTTYPLQKSNEIMHAVNHAIQTIISMYDPEEIILFVPTAWLEQIQLETVYLYLEQLFPYGVLPKITLSDNFEHYHQLGLIKIGLNLLDSNL